MQARSRKPASKPMLFVCIIVLMFGSLFPLSVAGAAQAIGGPGTSGVPADFPSWLTYMNDWRADTRTDIDYSDTEYNRGATQWAAVNLVETMAQIEDLYLYDPGTQSYTVDNYLDDIENRWGGVDRMMLWPTFPNMGIDERNQFDFYRSLPGGLAALAGVIDEFQQHGIKVMITDNSVWDVHSRTEPGSPHDNMVALAKELGADGVFGDIVQQEINEDWIDATYTESYPVVFEPEWNTLFTNDFSFIQYSLMSWNYSTLGAIPFVSASKWLEPRHMNVMANRWLKDRSGDLLAAFFNGMGYDAWENIFAVWNGITDRDAQYIKRVYTMLRRYQDLLPNANWEPHTPVLQSGVYASKFPSATRTLWTFVNPGSTAASGAQIDVPYDAASNYYDVYHGVQLTPTVIGNTARLSFTIEARGIGAVLMIKQNAIPGDHGSFLSQMASLTATPLSGYSAKWEFLQQTMTPIERTATATSAPSGMVFIPGTDNYKYVADSRVREGDRVQNCCELFGTDFQMPWEPNPRRHHEYTMPINDFYMDRYPVTNAQFKVFLDMTGYTPDDPTNFLKDWSDGTYPTGWGDKPVTHVSLEDARAYAAWAGKRLPHSWEWQYAAQGTDGRAYPWGNAFNSGNVPVTVGDGDLALVPDDVDAHPGGASPFGVEDLVGNVWQMTDEFTDEHMRAVLLKGGSKYVHEYFNNTNKVNEHQKYHLMAPSRDRSSMIGFRLVKDAPARGTSFLTAAYSGSRDNYTGWVGYEFTPSTDMTIYSLGRAVSGTMSQSHEVKLWKASDQSVVATATVTPSSRRDVNNYAYEYLATPVMLEEGTTYWIASWEYASGDDWMDLASISNHTLDATVQSGVWGSGSYPANVWGGADQGFGPPAFYYYALSDSFMTQAYSGSRDNYTGWVGYQFTPASDMSIDALGRAVSGSMTQSHEVKIWQVSDQSVVAAATVTPSSPRDANNYAYEHLASPVTLQGGTAYRIATWEYTGGDDWMDLAAISGHTAAAAVQSGVWGSGAYPVNVWGSADQGFVPPNFYTRSPGDSFMTQAYSGSRNDYTGYVGYQFTPASTITIEALGRAVSGSMTQSHEVKIWKVSDESIVAATAVTPSSPVDANQYAYAYLDSPITLQGGTAYRIASWEFAGGDNWMDLGTISGHTGAATIQSGVWGHTPFPEAYPGNVFGSSNQGFVPLNFYIKP